MQSILVAVVLLLRRYNAVTINSDIIICDNGWQSCLDWDLVCLPDADCFVQCVGYWACGNAQIICPTDDGYDCTVSCDGRNACSQSKIHGGGGDLVVIGSKGGIDAYSMSLATIYCPDFRECNVTCFQYGCSNAHIFGNNSILNIDASGYLSLYRAAIKCPDDGIKGNTNNCNINIHGGYYDDYPLREAQIYAVESFNDINLACEQDCFWESAIVFPSMHCTEDYSFNCTLTSTDHSNSSKWECIDPLNVCNNYLIQTPAPTSAPTVSPTMASLTPTLAPSTSPITYNVPYSSTNRLYVRDSGCDYGYCSVDYADFENQYCLDYNVYGSNSFCCSKYAMPAAPSPISLPLECMEYNVTIIDDLNLFKNTAMTNETGVASYSDVIKTVCFSQTTTICYKPIISVTYEMIDYSYNYRKRLWIAYGTDTNMLHKYECNKSPSMCGVFQDCEIDRYSYVGDPGDSPWFTGYKIFYPRNSYPVEPRCSNPPRSMNVEISVDCSTPFKGTCQSLNYTFSCFLGKGGYPSNTGCADNGYDGNGMIDIGSGTFYLYDIINNKHNQIIFKGNGMLNTVLDHTDNGNNNNNNNNVTVIKCEWIQCHITFRDLTYMSSNNNTQIMVVNGGNVIFENVLFGSFISFIIDGDETNIDFIDCQFKHLTLHSNVFTVTNYGQTTFTKCYFENNTISNNLFLLQNGGIVSIENSQFNYNHGVFNKSNVFFNKNTNMNGTIDVQNCLFDGNYNFYAIFNGAVSMESSVFTNNNNINQICYAFNTNPVTSIILKTKIWPSNNCINHCLSFLDSDLYIDERSVSVFAPTTSPSAAPTSSPTASPVATLPILMQCGQLIREELIYNKQKDWYKFRLPTDNTSYNVLFSTCDSGIEDSQMWIYANNWQLIQYCDDCHLYDYADWGRRECSSWYQSEMVVNNLYGNQTYYVAISEVQGDFKGLYNISVHCQVTTHFPTTSPTIPTFSPTNLPTFSPSNMPSSTPTNVPTAAPTQFVLEAAGCSDENTQREVVWHSIYACPGTIVSGGVYGVDAEALCGPIYHVCNSEIEARALGLTSQLCQDIAVNDAEFFATKESSGADWKCTSIYNESIGFNDIWGCSSPTTNTPQLLDCGVLNSGIGESSWGFWISNGSTTIEAKQYSLTNSAGGGVMCCIDPTSSPTFAPTMAPNAILQFGHSDNAADFITLSLFDFDPAVFADTVDLISFGMKNGSVIYEPCFPFDNAFILDENIKFNELSLSVSPTNIYNVHDVYVKQLLICSEPLVCFIQCVSASSVCIGASITTTAAIQLSLIECDTIFSCLSATLQLSLSDIAAIKCSAESSCKESIINVNNVDSFYLDCVEFESCMDLKLNITNVIDIEIRCYAINSCKGIRIYSDTNYIKLWFFNYNQDVNVFVPSHFIKENLNCNPLDAYLSINGSNGVNISLQQEIIQLFDANMPCENIIYSFTSTDSVDCDVRYAFYADMVERKIQNELKDYVACFERIYIDDIFDFDCYGTLSPTSDPTMFPTFNPSLEPTIDPTTDPTMFPTFNPTLNPTINPTLSPTKRPTRKPTAIRPYDHYFEITYFLGQLFDDNILQILESAVFVFKNVTSLIEEAYVFDLYPFLEFADFSLIIEKVNNIKITKINKKNMDLIGSKSELTLSGRILCNKYICNFIISTYNVTMFEFNAQNEIRDYFNSNLTTFAVDNLDTLSVLELYPQIPSLWLEPIVMALMIFIFLMTILSILAFLHNKQKLCRLPATYIVDNAVWVCFIVLAFQIFDFITDINLSFEMIDAYNTNKKNGLLKICAFCSVLFIVIPYVANLIMASKVKKLVSRNESAVTYFTDYGYVFVLIVCGCGSCYTSLRLVSSAAFGLNILNSGMTKYEIRKLSKLKIFGTIFLENIPQLITQFIYSYATDAISNNTYLSFTASTISVIAAIIAYYVEKNDEEGGNRKAVEYYISFNNNSRKMSDEETKTFVNNKGLTETLSKSISKVFATEYTNIEVAKQSTVTTVGYMCHFVHFINESDIVSMKQWLIEKDMNVMHMMISPQYVVFQLYSMFNDEVNDVFQRHFGVDTSFKINISQYGTSTSGSKEKKKTEINESDQLFKQTSKYSTNSTQQFSTIELPQIVTNKQEIVSNDVINDGLEETVQVKQGEQYEDDNHNTVNTQMDIAKPSNFTMVTVEQKYDVDDNEKEEQEEEEKNINWQKREDLIKDEWEMHGPKLIVQKTSICTKINIANNGNSAFGKLAISGNEMKCQWDISIKQGGDHICIGICKNKRKLLTQSFTTNINGYGYCGKDGKIERNGRRKKYGKGFGSGDKISMVLDMNAKTLSFVLNGQDQGIAFTDLPSAEYRLAATFNKKLQKIIVNKTTVWDISK